MIVVSGLAVLVAGLATWRLTVLLVDDEIAEPVRRLAGRWSFTERLVTCIACSSIWIGAGVTLSLWAWSEVVFFILLPFALSAVALILERLG